MARSHKDSGEVPGRMLATSTVRLLLIGGLAGLLATGPMTVAMNLLFKRLPRSERYPLPPARITTRVASRLGMGRAVDQPDQHALLTTVVHYGFGSAMGALYTPLGDRLPAPPVAKGILWGLFVWLGNYLGLLPALGLLPPATRNPRRRDLLMIAAHVVWGAVLGALTSALLRRFE